MTPYYCVKLGDDLDAFDLHIIDLAKAIDHFANVCQGWPDTEVNLLRVQHNGRYVILASYDKRGFTVTSSGT